MIPKECKRLAEVDFPIAVVSKHAAREKSIRHGHPSTLHLWWARRPLASCRAMLLALLFPDPCDEHCPEEFKDKARDLLPPVVGPVGAKDEDLRAKLLKFIGDFANWDLSANATWISVARGLVKAAHPDEPPLVVDPFAGGGSIPLEALRVGCEAFASDLNPVACLILKVMLEDIPRHGPELVEKLRRVGREIKEAAEKELSEFYPPDSDGMRPIAYLWARTVRCEAPNCGAEIPLARTLWLSTKTSRKRAMRYRVVRDAGEPPRVEFELFEPESERDVPAGMVMGAKGTCVACGSVLPPERVRAQLVAQRGGANVIFDQSGSRIGGARMLAVVTLRPNERGRHYRLPTQRDYEAVHKAHERLARLLLDWEREGKRTPCPVPDEPVNPIRPSPNARGLSAVTRYGMVVFGDLFTARQTIALATLSELVGKTDPTELRELLSFAISKQADFNSSIARWANHMEKSVATFGRQALPMLWDWGEVVPTSNATGSFGVAVDWIANAASIVANILDRRGSVQLADAAAHPLPDQTAPVWFTDPPYYDAIPYADLSDYFFVWLKRVLPAHPLLSDPFDPSNLLTPKLRECVWNRAYCYEGRPKNGAFFEATMNRCFSEGRRVLQDDGIAGVVFAHQTTEGWEAFLGGLIAGGWTVTASWPIATEKASRLRARENASLSTSIHLVCRPRPDNASIGDWAEVLRELPSRVSDWMERLQSEGVRGADLVFACIGPALEIFSRYSQVETAEGREVGLPEYLEKVWEVVGRTALEQVLGTAEAQARNGLAGALEEDARLTALFLWTLQTTNGEAASNDAGDSAEYDNIDEEEEAPKGKSKGYSLIFDVVRRFAQPLGIRLPDWEGRIIEMNKGVVRLLAITERSKQLFGESGAGALADEIEASPLAASQLTLFPEEGPTVRGRGRRRGRATTVAAGDLEAPQETTTLDRVHAAMLMQASGRSQALRNMLKAEQERGPDFLRLANALSALYPRGSEEKRLLDAMLLAVPR